MSVAFPAPRSPFVGRDRELSILHTHLAAAIAGRGSLVLIGGEAGIGKTALAERLARDATDASVNLLVGHCYDLTETPPYGPWREMAQSVRSVPLSADAPPVPRLDIATSQESFFAQTRDFLVASTADQPLLLLLEDLHWADTASLDLVRFVARTLASLPLLLVVTYRVDELDRHHPFAELIPLLVRESAAERIDLHALNADAIHALVRDRYDLPGDATARLVAYLLARTEGNALFITELLRTLEEEGLVHQEGGRWQVEAIAHAPVPRLLQQIIDTRLTRLGDTADALLAVAAVIGHAVPLAVWQAVAKVDDDTLLTLVERAEAAHLVTAWPSGEGIHFAHALIREALYESVPAMRRRHLHRQIGAVLAALPAPDPDAVAYQFQRAGDERAVAWLVRAGERAEDAFARRTAAERYEAAGEFLRSQPGGADESGWLRLRAAILRRYEDAAAALAHVERTLEASVGGADPRLVAHARIVHGYTLASHGAFGAALSEATVGIEALATLPPPDAAQRAREAPFAAYLYSGPLVVWSAFVGRFAEARERGEGLLRDAPTPPTARDDAARDAPCWAALAYIYAMQGEPGRGRQADEVARVAYDTADRHLLVIPPIRAAFVREMQAYAADDPRERERIVSDGEGTTRRAMGIARPGERVDYARYLELPLLVVEGRWREVGELADQLAAAYKTYSVTYPRRHALGLIARARGEADLAWQFVREAFPEGAVTEPGAMHFSHALAMQRLAIDLALDGGDLATARRWLDAHDHWLAWSGAVLGRANGHVLWARYHLLAGMIAQAETSAQSALADAADPRQPLVLLAAHRLLGELATARGRFDTARDHLDAASALADACGAPYERALILLARAELAAATGDTTAAIAALDDVRTICVPIDARPALAHAERIEASLAHAADPIAPSPIRPAGLSAREIEVLTLVAAGLGNAEIAERLFLSPRTVMAHVANIFGKIDVTNRAAATRFAADHGLV